MDGLNLSSHPIGIFPDRGGGFRQGVDETFRNVAWLSVFRIAEDQQIRTQDLDFLLVIAYFGSTNLGHTNSLSLIGA
jgi:hypothetical protein